MFLLTFYIVSCDENIDKTEKKIFANAIEQLKVDERYDWVVVLPGLGCHGCIQEGEFFMKKNISNTKILFVLTNISSLKIFQQKTDIRISEYPNVYIDRNNHFKLSTKNAIYPCIIQLDNMKISQYSFQSPKSSAFYSLQKKIK